MDKMSDGITQHNQQCGEEKKRSRRGTKMNTSIHGQTKKLERSEQTAIPAREP